MSKPERMSRNKLRSLAVIRAAYQILHMEDNKLVTKMISEEKDIPLDIGEEDEGEMMAQIKKIECNTKCPLYIRWTFKRHNPKTKKRNDLKKKNITHSFRALLKKRTHGDALGGQSIGREAAFLLDIPTKHTRTTNKLPNSR